MNYLERTTWSIKPRYATSIEFQISIPQLVFNPPNSTARTGQPKLNTLLSTQFSKSEICNSTMPPRRRPRPCLNNDTLQSPTPWVALWFDPNPGQSLPGPLRELQNLTQAEKADDVGKLLRTGRLGWAFSVDSTLRFRLDAQLNEPTSFECDHN